MSNHNVGKVFNIKDMHKTEPIVRTVQLPASGWDVTANTQTVTVEGVSADLTAQEIHPMPDPMSLQAYMDAGIRCIQQATDKLTFMADVLPVSANITLFVTIWQLT